MEKKNKILIKRTINQDNYNELNIEKSEKFLENLQDFVVGIGLAKVNKGEYEFEGKSYDVNTYYTLFYCDPRDDSPTKKLKIDEFGDGQTIRYFNKEIELIIIFLKNNIKLIFYSNLKNRKKVMSYLMKFCQIMKII